MGYSFLKHVPTVPGHSTYVSKLYRAAFSTLEQLESRRLLSADLVADHQGIYPTDSATLNGVSYFSANDGAAGTGTLEERRNEAGTKLVKDLVPGAEARRYPI